MEEQVLKFELTAAEANVVLAGLGKIPAEASMAIIIKMQQQASGQFVEAPQEVPQEVPATE